MRMLLNAIIGLIILILFTVYMGLIGFILGLVIVVIMSNGVERQKQNKIMMELLKEKE